MNRPRRQGTYGDPTPTTRRSTVTASPTFGIAIPQTVGPQGFDGAAVRAFVQRAEALGFASAWTNEAVLGTHPDLGPLEVMAYAAACTERIRFGCAVIVSSLV